MKTKSECSYRYLASFFSAVDSRLKQSASIIALMKKKKHQFRMDVK